MEFINHTVPAHMEVDNFIAPAATKDDSEPKFTTEELADFLVRLNDETAQHNKAMEKEELNQKKFDIPDPELVDILEWSTKAREVRDIQIGKENATQVLTPVKHENQALKECTNCRESSSSSWVMCQSCTELEPTKLFSHPQDSRPRQFTRPVWVFNEEDINMVATHVDCPVATAIVALKYFGNVIDAIIYLDYHL